MAMGTAFTGGRGAGNNIYMTFPNVVQVRGRIKQRAAGLALTSVMLTNALGEEIAEVARTLVAKDEWKTHDSIRVEQRGTDTYVVVDRGGERDEVPIYLEIGTHKMAARPFLKPASDLVMASGGLLRAHASVGGLLGHTVRRV